MNENVLEEYLVSLGFRPDQSSFAKFENILSDTDRLVEKHTSGMLGDLLKLQAGVIGVFTSISASIVTMAERVSMADQSYRLFGLSMLMTKDSARNLKMITDGLGVSLEQVIWDPELHARAVQMADDMNHFGKALLGADFDSDMKGIRDIRFEFVRLQNALKFLEMGFVNDVFKKLTGSSDSFSKSLHGWVTDFWKKLPDISDKLSSLFVPALKETWVILGDIKTATLGAFDEFSHLIALLTGDKSIDASASEFDKLVKILGHAREGLVWVYDKFKEAETYIVNAVIPALHSLETKIENDVVPAIGKLLGPAVLEAKNAFFSAQWAISETGNSFIHLVGIISGDHSLENATTNVDSLAKSFQHVVHWVDTLILDVATVSREMEHFANGVSLVYQGLKNNQWGPLKDAGKEFMQMVAPNFIAERDLQVAQDELKRQKQLHPDVPGVNNSGVQLFDKQGNFLGLRENKATEKPAIGPISVITPGSVQDRIVDASVSVGLDPLLALSTARHESHFQQDAVSPKGALGVFQLMPSTAKDLGVDPTDEAQNIQGGVRLLHDLLDRYHGDKQMALAAYNAGPSAVDKYHGIPPYAETQNYVKAIMDDYQKQGGFYRASTAMRSSAALSAAAAPSNGSVHGDSTVSVNMDFGGISINQPNGDPRDIRRAVAGAGIDMLESQTQWDLAQLSPLY